MGKGRSSEGRTRKEARTSQQNFFDGGRSREKTFAKGEKQNLSLRKKFRRKPSRKTIFPETRVFSESKEVIYRTHSKKNVSRGEGKVLIPLKNAIPLYGLTNALRGGNGVCL